jgi:hypothetical protein
MHFVVKLSVSNSFLKCTTVASIDNLCFMSNSLSLLNRSSNAEQNKNTEGTHIFLRYSARIPCYCMDSYVWIHDLSASLSIYWFASGRCHGRSFNRYATVKKMGYHYFHGINYFDHNSVNHNLLFIQKPHLPNNSDSWLHIHLLLRDLFASKQNDNKIMSK